jgi:hypothetical protein
MLGPKMSAWLFFAASILAAGPAAPPTSPQPLPLPSGVGGSTPERQELPELAQQARVFSVRLRPRNDQEWVEACLNLSLDQRKFNCRIVAYRIQWFSGAWSGWFVPGVNDLYKKPGEPLRRFWACFNDHTFEIIYQTSQAPVPLPDIAP